MIIHRSGNNPKLNNPSQVNTKTSRCYHSKGCGDVLYWGTPWNREGKFFHSFIVVSLSRKLHNGQGRYSIFPSKFSSFFSWDFSTWSLEVMGFFRHQWIESMLYRCHSFTPLPLFSPFSNLLSFYNLFRGKKWKDTGSSKMKRSLITLVFTQGHQSLTVHLHHVFSSQGRGERNDLEPVQHTHWTNICSVLAQQLEYFVLVRLGSSKGENTKIYWQKAYSLFQ